MNNLQAEADWWASDGKQGAPPNDSHIVEGPSPRQLFPTEMLSFPTIATPAVPAAVAPAPVAPAPVAAKETKYIPPHRRGPRSETKTKSVSKTKTRKNKGPQYRPSEHQRSAINLLNNRGFNSRKGGRGIIKLDRSDFFDINCEDIHIHVYNNRNTGQNGAGIRFRFQDGIELQYNIGDGGGKNGFYLVDTTSSGRRYWEVSNGLSLPKTIESLLKKLNTSKFRGSRCQQEIFRLNELGQLENFIQRVITSVQIASGAYQNPMAGLRGGKRKTRRRKKSKKRKTRRRKKSKKRKTRRKR